MHDGPADQHLPVAEALPRLIGALSAGANAVLIAPPGAGKTTLAPLALLGCDWLAGQQIVMLEPRRLAARAAAQRMAAMIGETAGDLIGFRTRLDHAVSDATRIEVVTEGLLVRRLLGDPTLDGIGCVIFDEVHERSLDSDLALAFCLDLQRTLRPELRLLAMSATADGAAVARLMGAAQIESAGRQFEVEIRHTARAPPTVRELPDGMARAVRAAFDDPAGAGGDILCFLPGVGEIRRTQAALASLDADILPLHGELAVAEQDLVLRPHAGDRRRRRVVLATSIAETSLTVPGVRIVIDGGWRRAPRLDPASGLSRLVTLRISRAAAAQRAGRAGREAPGLAIRLWSEAIGRGLAVQDRPEILDAELAGFCLDAAAWAKTMGTPVADLPLPDPPPAGAMSAATSLLTGLGALDEAAAITPLGARMAGLGAHPRLAAMMLAARDPAEAALAADLAALIEERDPLRPRAGSKAADPPAEISLRLALLAGGDHPDADRAALARIRKAAAGYRRRLRVGGEVGGDAAALLAAAFPDRIAQASGGSRGEPGAFRLSGGGSARLARHDPLADATLLVAAQLHVAASATRIKLAARLDPEALPASLRARATESVENALDSHSGVVMSRRRLRLGALVLRDRTVSAEPGETASLLAAEAASRLRTALDWSDAACQFQARVTLARECGLDPALPDLSDAALRATVADWLAPHLDGMTRMDSLLGLDLLALLRGRLDHGQRALIDSQLPTHLALPGGRAAIDYTGPVPQAAARAQAFYGMRETPKLAGGRLKLRLALLSPAGRAAAITGDLAGFWAAGWAETRRALRGRYPKHDWPEHPDARDAR
ncbi:ATP-dependent helicase HrpB [Lichenicoccus sp.]|uniref:ATP-dependent helicase HrpB n=1 Tax=Lichenicoccus sp. TaxID=2781899 RepID=UPI003D0E8A7D